MPPPSTLKKAQKLAGLDPAPELPPGLPSRQDMEQLQPLAAPFVRSFLPDGMPVQPKGATGDQVFGLYLMYVIGHGGPKAAGDLADGKRVVLGLRVETSTQANKGKGSYDDRIVVLRYDPTTHRGTADVYPANTDPSWQYDAQKNWKTDPKTGKVTQTANKKAEGKDVDGDGVKDLGRVPSGVYPYHRSKHSKLGPALRPDAPIRLQRDSNHDGVFDHRDAVKKELEGNLNADDTLIHKGGADNTWSAGCQTIAGKDFDRFWKALGTRQKNFYYVLVTVSKMVWV